MERKEAMLKTGCSKIFWVVLAVVMCAAPCICAEVIDYEIPGPDAHWIWGTTVDILTGANIIGGLYITPESIVNIHGGNIGGEGIILLQNGTDPIVTVHGTNFAGDGDLSVPGQVSFPTGSGILTVTYTDDNGDPIGDPVDLLFHSNIPINLVDTGGGTGPEPITIDIKPGSTPNAINLGSNGVVPVAILSTPEFDATELDPDTVFLAGSGVAVRGKGNKLLASEEDVNGDGLIDLVIKVETENLDPGTFQDGYAILQVIVDNTVIYEGSDEITIVPPE